jgi:hypothetical protein
MPISGEYIHPLLSEDISAGSLPICSLEASEKLENHHMRSNAAYETYFDNLIIIDAEEEWDAVPGLARSVNNAMHSAFVLVVGPSHQEISHVNY